MADQDGTVETGRKKRAVRGKWTAQQRREIVAASLVEGASINEVARAIRYSSEPIKRVATAARRIDRSADAQEDSGAFRCRACERYAHGWHD